MKFMQRLGGDVLSPGVTIVLAVALVSGLILATLNIRERGGREFWTFARNHSLMYEPVIAEWNKGNDIDTDGDGVPEEKVVDPTYDIDMSLLDGRALERRMMSGFLSGTPIADLIEVEVNVAGRMFAGPVEDVGFVDLRPRLEADGLLEQINAPSLTPWSREGRIFGLPHDVHPVVLCYNHAAVEAHNEAERGRAAESPGYEPQLIDLSRVETWDDYFREMRPLQTDEGNGKRYAINLWFTNTFWFEPLMRQAGGGLFDARGMPIIDSPENAMAVAHIVSWCGGPDRVAIDAPEFNPSGNQMRIEGRVLGTIMPDWLSGVWMQDMPQLAGDYRLMPLPAWEPGGRRTSVMGGTMLGITQQAEDFDAAYEFATHLYLDKGVAEKLYRENGIVSPMKKLWEEPFYHEPTEYFGGQPAGSLYIELAPDVPARSSTPFQNFANGELQQVTLALYEYATDNDVWDPAELEPRAAELLAAAQERVVTQMKHNVFLAETLDFGDED